MRQPILALAAAAALAGCSGSDSGPSAPPPPGCDHTAYDGTCFARTGLVAAQCTYGTFLVQGCPPEASVGTCLAPADGTFTYYYAPMQNAYDAHVTCNDAGGMWTGTGAPAISAWCDLTSTNWAVCLDMTGPADEVAVIQSECAAGGGSWHATGQCPTFGRTGTCSGADGGIAHWDRYYDPGTAANDAASCAAHAGYTWTPG